MVLARWVALIALGIYGWAFSREHCERFRMHTNIMKFVRGAIDNEFAGRGPQRLSLEDLRVAGEDDHFKNYPTVKRASQRTAKSGIARMRLHPFWEWAHIAVLILGFGVLAAILVRQDVQKPPTEVKIVW